MTFTIPDTHPQPPTETPNGVDQEPTLTSRLRAELDRWQAQLTAAKADVKAVEDSIKARDSKIAKAREQITGWEAENGEDRQMLNLTFNKSVRNVARQVDAIKAALKP